MEIILIYQGTGLQAREMFISKVFYQSRSGMALGLLTSLISCGDLLVPIFPDHPKQSTSLKSNQYKTSLNLKPVPKVLLSAFLPSLLNEVFIL